MALSIKHSPNNSQFNISHILLWTKLHSLTAHTCFESRLQWLALRCCLLEVHMINGAGVHGRWALSGRLRPRSSVWDEGAHCHSWWWFQSLTQPRWEKWCIRLECGAWRHWDSLLDLLRGWACGGEDAGPSRSWRVWERTRRRRIFAALQGARRVRRSEVGAIGGWLWFWYGRRGQCHFRILHLWRSMKWNWSIHHLNSILYREFRPNDTSSLATWNIFLKNVTSYQQVNSHKNGHLCL